MYVNDMWQQSNNILGQDAVWPIARWYSKGGPMIIEAKDAGFCSIVNHLKCSLKPQACPDPRAWAAYSKPYAFWSPEKSLSLSDLDEIAGLLRQKYILQFSYTMILFGFKCNHHNPAVQRSRRAGCWGDTTEKWDKPSLFSKKICEAIKSDFKR